MAALCLKVLTWTCERKEMHKIQNTQPKLREVGDEDEHMVFDRHEQLPEPWKPNF